VLVLITVWSLAVKSEPKNKKTKTKKQPKIFNFCVLRFAIRTPFEHPPEHLRHPGVGRVEGRYRREAGELTLNRERGGRREDRE